MARNSKQLNSPTFIVSASDYLTGKSDFMADGTADDVEIQAAIDALPSSGGTVYLTEGTFTLATQVSISANNISIVGTGLSTRLNLNESTGVIAVGTKTGVILRDFDTDNGWVDLGTSGTAKPFLTNVTRNGTSPVGVAGGADYTVSKDTGRTNNYFALNNRTGRIEYYGSSIYTVLNAFLNNLRETVTGKGIAIRNTHIVMVGSAEFQNAWSLSSQLVLPALQNCVIDARSVIFSTSGIRIESTMDSWLYFGVISGSTSNIALDINPSIAGPDGLTTFIDSRLYVSSIAGTAAPYTAGTVGLRFNAASGSIRRSIIEVINIHGFQKLVSIPNPGGGLTFDQNHITVQTFYNGTTGLQDGAANNTGNLSNTFHLNFDSAIDTTGVDIFGSESQYFIVSRNGACPANNVVVLESGATANSIYGNRRVAEDGWTDNSTNSTNFFHCPGAISSGTATISNGGTTVTVTHGLDKTPALQDIMVMGAEQGTNNPGNIWVSSITSTQFVVNCRSDPGASNLDIVWRAWIQR